MLRCTSIISYIRLSPSDGRRASWELSWSRDKLSVMTESFRRSGEYENPYQGDQQHASSPVNPEWPPPPAQPPMQ